MLPSFAALIRTFAHIGCINFGGPAGQIALMHRMLVDERKWIGEARFLNALNYCMLLPGPEAQQLATYIGWLMHGVRGGLAAGLLFILPGALVMLALSALYAAFTDAGWLQAMFFGIKCAVLAIVVEALLRVARRALKTSAAWAVAALAFVALFFFDAPFPLIVLASGLAGLLLGAAWFAGGGHAKGKGPEKGALDHAIDAGEINPERRDISGTMVTIGIWLTLWLAPVGLIAVILPGTVWDDIARFFSETAIVTFGGAYAVLSHVAAHAVETRNWLTAPEMLHGLALAETTPGPLILVLQHVGYLAAARADTGLDPVLAGMAGAMLTLWVTFVPSFLMIFAGAPYAETLHTRPRLSSALAAITAAVVGVILNLSLWFALHVLFGELTVRSFGPVTLLMPDFATLNLPASLLTAAALVAVLRFKTGVAILIAAFALLGLGLQWLGL